MTYRKDSGLFAKAFATTSGILLAILAFNIAAAIVVGFVFVVVMEIGKAHKSQPATKPAAVSRR